MPLEWINGRWHLDGQGIHAGTGMDLLGQDGEWFRVRIESANQGRELVAYIEHHGFDFSTRISPEYDKLRWRER